jgi:hypothetical protein
MPLSDADLQLDKSDLKKRIEQVRRNYEQTEERIGAATGPVQDAAIRYLPKCSTYLELLRIRLKGMK